MFVHKIFPPLPFSQYASATSRRLLPMCAVAACTWKGATLPETNDRARVCACACMRIIYLLSAFANTVHTRCVSTNTHARARATVRTKFIRHFATPGTHINNVTHVRASVRTRNKEVTVRTHAPAVAAAACACTILKLYFTRAAAAAACRARQLETASAET